MWFSEMSCGLKQRGEENLLWRLFGENLVWRVFSKTLVWIFFGENFHQKGKRRLGEDNR